MTTGTTQVLPPVRQDPRQVGNTLKKIINWNDAGISNAGVLSSTAFDNSLPAGAFITGVWVEIVTTFDGTTPLMTVGTVSTAYNNIVNSTDVDETTAGVYVVTRGLGRSLTAAADITPFVNLTLTTSTKGQAIIVIAYEGGWQS